VVCDSEKLKIKSEKCRKSDSVASFLKKVYLASFMLLALSFKLLQK